MSLFERERELATGRAALVAASAGQGGVVVVGGPPGIGRSALLDALAQTRSPDVLLLRANGSSAEQDFAFGLVQQLLQPLVLDDHAGAGGWFRGAAGLTWRLLVDEPWSTEHVADETLLHGLHTLLLNVSEDRPVLLVVDDLQWADGPSLRWLGYLARRVSSSRILLACAIRECSAVTEPLLLSDFAAAASHTVQPEPLSAAAVSALAGEFDVDCPYETIVACHTATGGNPAALTAILVSMRATGSRPHHAADCQPLLCEWRRSCLAAAPETARGLADALAVLDDAAEPDLLRDLSGLDRLEYKSAFATLDRSGLLANTAAPRLVHSSLRAEVLAAMPVPRRQRLHRSAARLLREAGWDVEQVARQVMLAGPGLDGGEETMLRAAAGAALDRGAAETAARYLRAALVDRPAESVDRARLLVHLAVAERATDPGAAARHVLSALPFLAQAERAAAVSSLPPFLAQVNPAVVGAVCQAADDAGAHGDSALRLAARTRLLSLHGVRDPDSGPELAWPADVTELAATGAGREWLAVLAHDAALRGARPAADVAALAERILAGEPTAPAHVHTALPVVVQVVTATDTVAALEGWLAAARGEAGRRGSAGERTHVEAEWAVLRAATGDLAEAGKTATEVLAVVGQDWPEAQALAVTTLTAVALRTQDVELARRLLLAGEPSVDPRLCAAERLLRGMIDMIAGDRFTARDRFLECGRALERSGWTGAAAPPWRVAAVAAHRALGELDAAGVLAAEQWRIADEWGSAVARGRALLLRASLASGAEELALLRDAVEVLRGSADRLELAGALVILGRRLRAAGRPGADELAEGDRIAGSLGLYWGEVNSPYGGPSPRLQRSGRVPLTKTEEAVVALVRRGWTNQRVADDLGVTRRAVEKTLTGVYRKLGVPGRAALQRGLGQSD